MRLIDANALIAEYDRVHIGEPGKARKLIEDAPTIEPERAGKWIKISPAGIYECSECGKNVMTSDIEAYEWCHGCGARMEPI